MSFRREICSERHKELFNQVSPDHIQEWLNNVGKAGGGIVGITKKTRRLWAGWALSYNIRYFVSSRTKEMFLPDHSDDYLPPESSLARQKRDTEDENKVITMFECVR